MGAIILILVLFVVLATYAGFRQRRLSAHTDRTPESHRTEFEGNIKNVDGGNTGGGWGG